MDYWHSLDVHHHDDWESFRGSPAAPGRIWLFTTKSDSSFWDAPFVDGDGLLFGNEEAGCPEWLHSAIPEEFRITIPHADDSLRSLNLSTSVGIGVYEAYRRVGLPRAPG